MGTNIFAFIVVLGVLIFFHELGHFLMARIFGVGVEKFSLGFGPRIFGKKIGRTDYRISALPLGGYVKMVGEEPDAEIDPTDIPFSFTHKHVLKRILIVAAGPAFNLLLAVIIFFWVFQVSGIYILKPSVGSVTPDSPAQRAGIQKGDLITAINDRQVTSWEEMANAISGSNGKEIRIHFRRDGSLMSAGITPELKPGKSIFGEEINRYVIGIASSGETFEKDLTIFEAITESVSQTYQVARLTLVGIAKLIQGSVSTKTLGGPIMIAQMAGDQAKAGAGHLIFFIALISINLAVINFLPIPILDGGHILFFIIEGISGRPLNTRMREIAQQVGIFILALLMIYVFYNDIARIFFS
ncbi:MAG: RIP metalloprotease RseP [Thermodesulfobacteriota bacterium]